MQVLVLCRPNFPWWVYCIQITFRIQYAKKSIENAMSNFLKIFPVSFTDSRPMPIDILRNFDTNKMKLNLHF